MLFVLVSVVRFQPFTMAEYNRSNSVYFINMHIFYTSSRRYLDVLRFISIISTVFWIFHLVWQVLSDSRPGLLDSDAV